MYLQIKNQKYFTNKHEHRELRSIITKWNPEILWQQDMAARPLLCESKSSLVRSGARRAPPLHYPLRPGHKLELRYIQVIQKNNRKMQWNFLLTNQGAHKLH